MSWVLVVPILLATERDRSLMQG